MCSDSLHVDIAIHRVVTAARTAGEAKVTRDAGVDHTSMRGFGTDRWNPTLRTIRALEAASRQILVDSAEEAEPGETAETSLAGTIA